MWQSSRVLAGLAAAVQGRVGGGLILSVMVAQSVCNASMLTGRWLCCFPHSVSTALETTIATVAKALQAWLGPSQHPSP